VFKGESIKIIAVDTVLAAGQSERSQVAFFYPSQHGYFAYTTMPGNGAGGEILRVVVLDDSQD
jgi:hypothetical protein